jgi:hypothetical protein
LKRVVGIRLAVENAPAYVQHQTAMPSHQRRERRFIPSNDEASQEIEIRQAVDASGIQIPLQMSQSRQHLVCRHVIARCEGESQIEGTVEGAGLFLRRNLFGRR